VFEHAPNGVQQFTMHPKHSGEKILEAIQMAWMDEGDFEDDN
jgi:FeS assembly protein IscX